jgi:2-C-methyl-D-erythritol 4-phosphate cytidylyltransferase
MTMKKYAIIAAGGTGTRMGNPVPKQFLQIGGKTILWHSLDVFFRAFADIEVILVLPEDHLEIGYGVAAAFPHPESIRIVKGGKTRFDSVKNGVDLVEHPSIVFVHDAVRCLLSTDLIRRCYDLAMEKGNAIPALPAIDSVRIESGGRSEAIDRNRIRLVQTPQTFQSDILKAAYQQDYQDLFTDEAMLVEMMGVPVHLLEGEADNIKITTSRDLAIAEAILSGHARKN